MAKANKKIKPMFWITGNYYDSQNRWQQIVGLLKDPNIELLDGGIVTARDVIFRLKMKDMFDDRPRILKLKGLPDDYMAIANYLHLVRDDNVLVIDGPVGVYRDRRFITAASSKLYKTIKSKGQVFDHPMQAKSSKEAISWVQGVCEGQGKKIEHDAAEFLVELKGLDLDYLYADIGKLCAYVSNKKITKNDVDDCCVSAFLQTVWDLIEHLDARNYEKSISFLQQFYQIAGTEPNTSVIGDVENLLAALYQHFEFLIHVVDSSSSLSHSKVNDSIGNLKKRVKKDGKISWSTAKYSPQFVYMNLKKDALKHAAKRGKQGAYAAFRDTMRCRERVRISLSESAIFSCLDALCMGICGVLKEHEIMTLMGFSDEEIKQRLLQ